MERIFIGDVQGCADELDALLERARVVFGDVEAWLVGDLVNRGPDDLGVLRRVRELADAGRARCVLGNHDLALLAVAFGLRALRPHDTFAHVLAAPDADDWVEWLRRQPVALVGEVESQPFAMVHAAVHPDWTLAAVARAASAVAAQLGSSDPEDARRLLAADPERDLVRDTLDRLTRCRGVLPGGAWTSAPPDEAAEGSEPWHRAWARSGHDYGVVYGHWSLQGLHVADGLRGLDTGCVHHGRGRDGYLTAWAPGLVPAGDRGLSSFASSDERFLRVRARRPYYEGDRSERVDRNERMSRNPD